MFKLKGTAQRREGLYREDKSFTVAGFAIYLSSEEKSEMEREITSVANLLFCFCERVDFFGMINFNLHVDWTNMPLTSAKHANLKSPKKG